MVHVCGVYVWCVCVVCWVFVGDCIMCVVCVCACVYMCVCMCVHACACMSVTVSGGGEH